ncbi:MAG: hypothetical protein LUE97_03130 [Oscillospiraceae bacterium]|nr:hypothetical protein [Oscillospiraceae bacterium]
MDNRTYRENFIRNNFQAETDDYVLISNFFKRVTAYEKQYGKTLEEGYTKDEYLRLINSLGTVALSTFRNTKVRLRKYVEQLNNDEIISSEAVSALEEISYDMIEFGTAFSNRFFKDFGDLQWELDMVLRAADKIDDRVFYSAFSAIYLAWCGLTSQETLNLKREDIGVNYINVGNRTIIPNATIMAYLNEYKNATVYYVQTRSEIAFWYKESPWLMRTYKSERVSRNSLTTMISNLSTYNEVETRKFNEDTQEYETEVVRRNRGFTYDKVYWSGVFYRAYIYEGQNGKVSAADKETLAMLFPQSRGRKAADSFKLYQEYKKYFYPERSKQ